MWVASGVSITRTISSSICGPPSREDRTARVPFVLELSGRPGPLAGLPVRFGPLVQPLAVVAAEEIVGVGDVPVEGHRHVEH